MQSTTLYSAGAIVTVAIRFTNQRGTEFRPAIVVSAVGFNQNSADVVLIPVSSKVENLRYGDTPINGWQQAGLLRPSKAKAVIQTVDKRMIRKHLGSLNPDDLDGLQQSMKTILGI